MIHGGQSSRLSPGLCAMRWPCLERSLEDQDSGSIVDPLDYLYATDIVYLSTFTAWRCILIQSPNSTVRPTFLWVAARKSKPFSAGPNGYQIASDFLPKRDMHSREYKSIASYLLFTGSPA